MKMQQYVLAELEIRRAEELHMNEEEKQDLLMIRGEMEVDKLKPDLEKAIHYFNEVNKCGNFNMRASLHKVECLMELERMEQRLEELTKKDKLDQAELIEKAYGLYLSNRYEKARKAYDDCFAAGMTVYP